MANDRGRPPVVIIGNVSRKHPPEMVLAEHHHVAQALPPNAPDEALRIGILPGTPRDRAHLRHAQAGDPPLKDLAVHRIPVAEDVPGRRLLREGLHQLLRGPLRGRMRGHIEVQNPPPVMRQHEAHEEHPEADRRDREESRATISAR
jgi:hypothetical protein